MLVLTLAAFLPWAVSGRVSRSAFALAKTADELGVVEGPPARTLFVALGLLPAAAALTWIAAVQGWRRTMATLGAVGGLLAVSGAVTVRRAPVETGAGVAVAAFAGVGALVGAALVAASERNT